MGINISLVRVLGKEIQEHPYVEYWNTEKIEFDFLRQSGDKEFINVMKKVYLEGEDNIFRPTQPQLMQIWVKQHAVVVNKKRLDDALEMIIQNEDVWFHLSH